MIKNAMMAILLSAACLACGSHDSDYAIQSQQLYGAFPLYPDPEMTPGSLCQRPTERRYPEGIDYCRRNVDTSTKKDIIRSYDRTFGYSIERMNRADFKIDHYIPLCAGGSNERSNLWPQHKSVYILTDASEGLVCTLMQRGEMLQAEAIELIRLIKNNHSQAGRVESDLRRRVGKAL